MEKTVWEMTADALRAHGIEVYPPATKQGECTEEYVVIKQDGSSQIGNISSQTAYYTIMMYVPKNSYTYLEKFKQIVKGIMATDMHPILHPTGQETPDFYDDTVKAHMVSVMYRNSIRNTQL